MKLACWEHIDIFWWTLSYLRMYLKKKEAQLLAPKQELQTRCKQPSLWAHSRSTADQPIRVWTEEAEIQVYLEELDGMKQTDIFANESSRNLLSFLKPEDDSYKGSVQRDLEDRMMRMVRTRKEDNLQWKQSVSKVKVEIPSQDCQMEQMLQMRCSALDGPKTLEKVYKSKGLGFYGRHFRGTHGKYRKLENIQRPQSIFTFSEDSFVQTSCNIYIYIYIFLGKPTAEEAFYKNQVAYTCEDHWLKV